jgi:spore photoproduct lyase
MKTRKSSPSRPGCVRRPRSSKFVEIFRTTPAQTVCPNFFVLAHADGCNFDPACKYCYLKSSHWSRPKPEVFTNVDKIIRDVDKWIARDNLESHVLNMGNLSDSLTFEADRPLVARLVDLFRAKAAGRPHTLLLVTKGGTKECAPLFKISACPNVAVSFSVNSPEAGAQFEQGAAPVKDRLAAAKRLKKNGWRIRMRIDPMILGFDYAWVVEQVRKLSPERITLGTLRAERNLPRFTEKGLFDKLEPNTDNRKLSRYPLDLRLDLYRQATKKLNGLCPIGLCEETPDVWDALGLDKESKSCNCGG